MSYARRKFLQKGLLGLLSISLLPASFSILRKNDHAFSLNELFAQLSFKKGFFSSSYLNEQFNLPIGESEQISRNGKIFYSDKTFCIQEFNQLNPGFEDVLVSIYEKTFNGYKKVISLNQMELKAFSSMISYLKEEYIIIDPEELHGLLVPTFRTKRHLLANNRIDGICTSCDGYYTANGYCSMKIKAKGNSYKIDTRILNFKKSETYRNSFNLNGNV